MPRGHIAQWFSLLPLWELASYFPLLEGCGAERVVALSSASLHSKADSKDPREAEIAAKLASAETSLSGWGTRRGIDWVILRPTLIYGLGRDKNIAVIARFIRSFGFFPLVGAGSGLRQPLAARDLARAMIQAMHQTSVNNRSYDLSGAETLSYRQMVARIFYALGKPPRFLPLPVSALRLGIRFARLLPSCRHWSVEMANRMNRDLLFEYDEASIDFGFNPGGFRLSADDVLR